MEMPVQATILEQYKIYNESKEKYIDRNFTTNRFYTVLCLIILLVAYIIHLLTPSLVMMMSVCALGMFTSSLWWLNVDSYNTMIKIKYQHVLEILEQSLPKQPFREEFTEFASSRGEKKSFLFPDVQKMFSSLVFCSFAAIAIFSFLSSFKFN